MKLKSLMNMPLIDLLKIKFQWFSYLEYRLDLQCLLKIAYWLKYTFGLRLRGKMKWNFQEGIGGELADEIGVHDGLTKFGAFEIRIYKWQMWAQEWICINWRELALWPAESHYCMECEICLVYHNTLRIWLVWDMHRRAYELCW